MDTPAISPAREHDLVRLRRRPGLQALLNVFTPNDPIGEAARFAGRSRQLEQVTDALLTRGADLMIFGERGSGKSSLARMLHSIATGEYEVLDYYGLRESLERRGRIPIVNVATPWTLERTTFTTIWVDGFGKSFEEVIHAALTRRKDDRFGPGLLAYLPTEADQVEVASKIGFNKVFTGEASVKEVYVPEKPINMKEGFELATQTYADRYPDQELLIIVDEFETVTNRTDIAQYMKSANARFALVGIASTVVELVPEHASVARDTHAVEVPPMTEAELGSIVRIGSYVLSDYARFTDEAMEEIARASHGSPYWCHYLARGLVQARIDAAGSLESFVATRGKPAEVQRGDVRALIEALPERADTRFYEETLNQMTMGDLLSERVLGALASMPGAVVTSTAVADSLAEQGVSREDSLATIAGFVALNGSPLEERARVRDIVSVCFRDPNFKRYVLLRGLGAVVGAG